MEVGRAATGDLEAGQGPGSRQFKTASDAKLSKSGAHVGRVGSAAGAHPDAAVEFQRLATGRINLVCVLNSLAEEIAMVGADDDRLRAKVGQGADDTTEQTERAVHRGPGCHGIAALAGLVDLLRGDDSQVRPLDLRAHGRLEVDQLVQLEYASLLGKETGYVIHPRFPQAQRLAGDGEAEGVGAGRRERKLAVSAG